MSKIIQVLEQMGSDASLNNEHEITALLANADISDSQQRAILAKNAELLAETIADLPEIKCFIIAVADDDEQEKQDKKEDDGSETSNKLAIVING